MGQTWGLGLPELGLCPGEEVGDSAVVGSLVPLIPEDLCEKLTWGHQAFHWPWGEGPEGWVVLRVDMKIWSSEWTKKLMILFLYAFLLLLIS